MRSWKSTGLVMFALFLAGFAPAAMAEDGPPQYVIDAVDAVLAMLNSDGDAAIETFIGGAMIPVGDRDQKSLMERLSTMRNEMRGLREDVAVEREPNGVRLILAGGGTEKQIMMVLNPEGIADLYLLKAAPPLDLTRDTLRETLDRLEAEGMSGVIYVRLNGEVALEHAFGTANTELEIPNALNTIFGTGSRPIDYTMAAIYLLDQQGHIKLDDTIDNYFEDVPSDKRPITIRHLMTGRSGLPDFFHTESDWDPDLAWIDRLTAEKRLLSQELLFAPGKDAIHSHGAFGLLAALIERVAGVPYYDFIRENFFDPAGMNRTGEYGEARGLSIADFAAGGGPKFAGLPNIPPNWGPTSWLIKGSGGMYSTLGDLRKFYDYVRSGQVLDEQHSAAFRQSTVNLDGSDRGFELFSIYRPPNSEVFLFINAQEDRGKMRQLIHALERLVEAG